MKLLWEIGSGATLLTCRITEGEYGIMQYGPSDYRVHFEGDLIGYEGRTSFTELVVAMRVAQAHYAYEITHVAVWNSALDAAVEAVDSALTERDPQDGSAIGTTTAGLNRLTTIIKGVRKDDHHVD